MKRLSLTLALTIILAMAFSTNILSLNIGDKLGDVLYSDIKAYINGNEIPCYNIDNKIAVITSDLRNYGFDTKWDANARTIAITLNTAKPPTPLKIEHGNKKVGTVVFSYVYTDIQAFVDGIEVDSYNIDGKLCIGFRDLSVFGNYIWNGETRTVSLTTLTEADKAKNALEAIIEKGNIRELNTFISQWSNKSDTENFINHAKVRIEELKSDSRVSASILNNPNEATASMIEEFLRNYPGHKDEQQIRALSIGELMELTKAGTIAVSITGNSIDFTSVKLTNKAKRDITVTISLGIYFSPQSNSVQSMVVRTPKTVTLSAKDSLTVSVATACMNIYRDIPTSANSFSVSTLDVESKLYRVVKLLDKKAVSYAVAQTAIWIVTDNPGDYELLNTLVYSDGEKLVSSGDLATAKEIVREAK